MLRVSTIALVLGSMAAAPALAAQTGSADTDLNLRAGPGPNYQVIGVIGASDEVSIDGCLADSNWCKVAYDGKEGWAYGDYLTAMVDAKPVVVYPNREQLQIGTVTYEEPSEGKMLVDTGIAATAGAAAGAIIGGPVAIGVGAVAGAIASDNPEPPKQETITYVMENPVEPVILNGEVVVGAQVPQDVQLYTTPNSEVSYLNVNGQEVLVTNPDRKIVYIVR